MKKKNNAKERLIQYLYSKPNENISREEIIQQTGISRARLSELIKELRTDGYEISTPNRSGIVKLESATKLIQDITPKEIRQWLIILALAKLGNATYMELVCSILSIADANYLYNKIDTDFNYSDMDILNYLQKFNHGAKKDIDEFLPLPTFRKDLHDLLSRGYINKKRTSYKNRIHVVYSISEKSPTILFKSDDELNDFMLFYDNFKSSFSSKKPLESLYKKLTSIYDWEGYDNATQIYGKLNRIDTKQLKHLNNFIKYPYKTKSLHISYLSPKGKISSSIDSILLFYSVETNCFYLLCTEHPTENIVLFRLDKIISIKEENTENKHYRKKDFLDIYDEMFSAEYTSQKTHVKILFEDFGNIREQLVFLHNKRKSSKLYDIEPLSDNIPHSIVYEDDLRGIYSFSRYLRSFGSSALVLEPAELRKLIIDSNQNILNNYEVITNENE